MRFFAYIDPGTGSFIFQAVIGTAVGVIFAARTKIRALVGKLSVGPNKQSGNEDK